MVFLNQKFWSKAGTSVEHGAEGFRRDVSGPQGEKTGGKTFGGPMVEVCWKKRGNDIRMEEWML